MLTAGYGGARRWSLVPGVAYSLIGTAIWHWAPNIPGVTLTNVAALVATRLADIFESQFGVPNFAKK